ncbi:hypothetical protein [Albibacillus kandeliae]|uniref:hypothetical protein n=1 Tax=Albibacillus kandeliae TaxID=2174228 RepID=UPI001E5C086D|nr:hypothetical protein [Albibacillus kandeliae]
MTMHIRSTALVAGLAVALTALGGCSTFQDKENRILFDGINFRTKSKRIDDDWSRFTVTVPNVSRSLTGALEAGDYEGTRYCVTNFGTSRIKWTVGPDTPPQQLPINKDDLTLSGECNP